MLYQTSWSLRVMHVWELLPPAEIEPLEGRLLTSVPALPIADTWERVRWYRWSFLSEAFPSMLKSGCRMESRHIPIVNA